MAKVNANPRKQNKIDIQDLSERDRDFLTLTTKDAMIKYNVGKQSVYDRKFALNKKMREASLSDEKVFNNNDKKKTAAKSPAPKKAKQAKAKRSKQAEPKPEEKQPEPIRDVVKYEKPIPVIMKPIEITFETFSIKLNGVPKKIAVNPETNSIEIDL